MKKMYKSNIINFSPSDNINKYIKKLGPIILDFSATWCAPCQSLFPMLHSTAEKYKFTLIIIDVDKNKKISQQYRISSIPHLYLYIDGQLDMECIGFDQNQLSRMIKLAVSKVNKFSGKKNYFQGNDSKKKEFLNNKNNFLNESPDNNNVFDIRFKYNSDEFERRFLGNNTIGEVKDYVSKKIGVQNICFFSPFSGKKYDNDNATIESCGFAKKEVLSISIK